MGSGACRAEIPARPRQMTTFSTTFPLCGERALTLSGAYLRGAQVGYVDVEGGDGRPEFAFVGQQVERVLGTVGPTRTTASDATRRTIERKWSMH